MLHKYLRFTSAHWKPLLFGGILMALSSFGQTYFVALSGPQFRQAFDLSDGGLGTIYAIGTVLSALTLPWLGRLIDRVSVRRYSIYVAGLLTGACLLTAFSPAIFFLGLSFYLLRLGGQGLMVHTAMTATARTFPVDAGKALGVIALGLAIAQAIMPLAAVSLIEHLGWRPAWVINALIVVGGTVVALKVLPRQVAIDAPRSNNASSNAGAKGQNLWQDTRLLVTLPVILASPFVTTGFFFHQVRLAEEKSWSISWVAAWFIAYAITQAISLLVAGPIIDRIGPKRSLPYFMAPQAVAMLALAMSDSIWAAPVYLILTGISSAVASTLATALWMQLYGPEQLSRIRSFVGAWTVIASGASPVVMGLLIDRGVSLQTQALGCFVYMVLASLLSFKVMKLGHDSA